MSILIVHLDYFLLWVPVFRKAARKIQNGGSFKDGGHVAKIFDFYLPHF